jgi:hypothetical protein
MAGERLSAAYVRIVLGGAQFEDGRLDFLRRIMTDAELELAKQRLGAAYLKTLPPPPTNTGAPTPDVTEIDFVGLYLEIIRRGARPDDPRLAAMLDVMTDEQLEQGRKALGELWLQAEPVPAKAN